MARSRALAKRHISVNTAFYTAGRIARRITESIRHMNRLDLRDARRGGMADRSCNDHEAPHERIT